MAWTTIPNTDIDPESPITTALMTALRDNVAAAMNGDTGAPKLQPLAFRQAVSASTYQVASSDTEVSTFNTSYTKYKEIWCPYGGSFNVMFRIRNYDGSTTVYGRIYVNGSAVGTQRSTTSSGATTFTETISVSSGDLIQIYIRTSSGSASVATDNFRIRESAPVTSFVTTL